MNSKKNYKLYHLYKLAKFLLSVKLVDKATIACNLCLELGSDLKKVLKLKKKVDKSLEEYKEKLVNPF